MNGGTRLMKAKPARQLVDNANFSWTWSVLHLGKAQTPRVEVSQGDYCPNFIQPTKQTNKCGDLGRLGVLSLQLATNARHSP